MPTQLINEKAERNKGLCLDILDKARKDIESNGARAVAIVYVLPDGSVSQRHLCGQDYFLLLGAMTDMQRMMGHAADEDMEWKNV